MLKSNTQWKKESSSTKYLFPFERKEQRWQKQEKIIEGGLYGKGKSNARIRHTCILILMGKGGIYANDLEELREKEKRLMKDRLDGPDVYAAGNADLN